MAEILRSLKQRFAEFKLRDHNFFRSIYFLFKKKQKTLVFFSCFVLINYKDIFYKR